MYKEGSHMSKTQNSPPKGLKLPKGWLAKDQRRRVGKMYKNKQKGG
mgnify:CR=1 FL=1